MNNFDTYAIPTMHVTNHFGTVGILKISDALLETIDSLHKHIGSTEWSGILFYTFNKGNIAKLKNLEFEAHHLYPMNIGNHAYTEFEYSGDIVNAYDLFPEAIEQSSGMIHSHHTMQAFFSSTDLDELLNNCKHFNYYISLIVSFHDNYVCKIAFPSDSVVTSMSQIKGVNGETLSIQHKKKLSTILTGDLEVIVSRRTNPTHLWLVDRIGKLQELKSARKFYSPDEGTQQLLSFDGDHPVGDFVEASVYRNMDAYNFSQKNPTTDKPTVSLDRPIDTLQPVYVSPNKFLLSIINLNSKSESTSIPEALIDIHNNANLDIDKYEELVDTHIEMIHYNLYGSPVGLTKHCLEALTVLEDIEETLKESEAYNIIRNCLLSYV